ncbi:hypothetical protein KKG45_04345 [bacterium]|nr:hypothetical protein [bacterium]MBU1072457.1 hypothetical protein [bacterium]MBU1675590.1 hypothetical protein [bacterium]
MIDRLQDMSRDQIAAWLEDAAKLWLAHDGLWFQSIEKGRGMAEAMAHDAGAWARFSPLEAKRIMKRLGIEPGGGIPSLIRCLEHRLYALLNAQEIVERSGEHCVFQMSDCRVQSARARRGLGDFPCKAVGQVEYETFARTIDPRLTARCLGCPPDPHPVDWYCRWEFRLEE